MLSKSCSFCFVALCLALFCVNQALAEQLRYRIELIRLFPTR